MSPLEQDSDRPFLSIVIPAYNEEHRLPATLRQVMSYMSEQTYASEVLVVDNGSEDGTAEVVRSFLHENPSLRLLQEKQRGKGLAVRHGMLNAKGKHRFICDADLSMPIQEINRFLPPAAIDFDIAIASREVPGAIRYDEPAYRHWIGRAYNLLVRTLAIPGIMDTQCGFKCFRGRVAHELFSLQRLDGWGFDVEVLFIALRHGYRILEVPIPWYFNPDSRIRPIRDSISMFIDLIQIRINWFKGLYGPPT